MSDQTLFTVYARSHRRRSCTACGVPIDFYQNAETDRWIPFDAGVVIRRSFPRAGDRVVCHEIAGVTHFATCPQAATFRRKTTPAAPVRDRLF